MLSVLSLCNFLGSHPHRHGGRHLPRVGVPLQPAGRGTSMEGSRIHTPSRCGPEVARLPPTHIPLASPCCQVGGGRVVPRCVCACSADCRQRERGGTAGGLQHWDCVIRLLLQKKRGAQRGVAACPCSHSKEAAEPEHKACCLGCNHLRGTQTPLPRRSGEQGASCVSGYRGPQTPPPPSLRPWLTCSAPQLCHLSNGLIVVVHRGW